MKVFELIENDEKQVILKVHADNNLVIARHPYLSGDFDYITVTKGANHLLTIVKKDGTTFSIHWGTSGHTLVCEDLKLLKSEVVHFIEQECFIPLDIIGNARTSAKIYFNSNFGQWQLVLNGVAYIRRAEIDSLEKMKEYAKNYIDVKAWEHGIAPTGIDVWYGVL